MRYKDFEGTLEELVEQKLQEIEEKEHVRILHAVESGSRSWGFASPDSDYDVRFIYVRRPEDYLKLEPARDVIEWELDETLDINGWDLQKALRQYHRSNSTLFEWANSPVVYRTTEEWRQIHQAASVYFSEKAAMYHYYGTAKSNFLEFLQGDTVKYKKYFYVIRPVLACKWIEEHACPPPESGAGERIEVLNHFIEGQLDYYKMLLDKKTDDRRESWDVLDRLFLESLKVR